MRRVFITVLLAMAFVWGCGEDAVDPPLGGGGGSGGEGTGGSAGNATSGPGGTGGTGGMQSIVGEITIEARGLCAGSCFEVHVGEERQLVAHVFDHDGNELMVPVIVDWASDDETVLTVSPDGVALGIAEGEVTVSATAEGVTGTAQMTVLPPVILRIEITPKSVTLAQIGDTAAFTAVAYDEQDNVVPDAPISWLASNPHVGSIDANGVLTGVGQGHTVVLAGSGFAEGWATATVVSPLSQDVPWQLSSVTAGGMHACGVTPAFAAYCWGYNFFGQLGNGDVGNPAGMEPRPVAVTGSHQFASIVAGLYHTCALTPAGQAWCWGSGDSGQLGNGDDTVLGSPVPIPVVGSHTFEKLAAGGSHTCGIEPDGDLFCWGNGLGGALGNGSTTNSWTPVQVAQGTAFDHVVTGLWHTCAITGAAETLCWGTDSQGSLGNNSPDGTIQSTPGPVSGTHHFVSLDSYGSHTCAIALDGSLWCWGRNDTGQVGDGTLLNATVPTQTVSPDSFVAVATGAHHTCGRTSTGATQCWGDGGYGQLGDGTLGASTSPVAVLGGLPFAALAGGSHFTCGSLADTSVYCWGTADLGQLGADFGGPGTLSAVPVPLAAP